MFLLRVKFWMFGALALLVVSIGVFGFVAAYHKRAQDPNRTPHEQQQNENTSETLGYFGAFAAGLSLITFLLGSILWIVRGIINRLT